MYLKKTMKENCCVGLNCVSRISVQKKEKIKTKNNCCAFRKNAGIFASIHFVSDSVRFKLKIEKTDERTQDT